MNQVKKTIFNLFVAILFVIGLFSTNQTVYGKTKAERLIGTVVSVDRETRTLKVRDNASKRVYNVFVPVKKQIKLHRASTALGRESFVEFERMMRGLVVDVTVAGKESAE